MAEVSDVGVGGGSTTNICIPSPSDQYQITDNILNRLKLLEDAVSQLLAENISAGQLSDLSQQVGWVGNITYAGIPGWTQTEYGTLIPPPGFSLSTVGFTMSDGSTFPAVVMDSDGVLQYGFGGTSADGTFLPVAGEMASSINYGVIYTNNPIRNFTTSTGSTIADLTIAYNPAGILSLLTSQRFQVSKSGYYLLTSTCGLQCYNDATGNGEAAFRWIITGNTSSYDFYSNNGPFSYLMSNGLASHSEIASRSKIMYLSSSAYSELSGLTSNGGGTPTMYVGGAVVTVQLLQGVATP